MAAVAVAALTLAGCGLGSAEDTAGSQPTVSAGAEVKGEVSLQTWALKPKFTSYVEGVIKAFETKYPGTKVTWLDQPGDGYDKKVLSQASAGQLPGRGQPAAGLRPAAGQAEAAARRRRGGPEAREDVRRGRRLRRTSTRASSGTYGYPWYLNTDIDYWNADKFAAVRPRRRRTRRRRSTSCIAAAKVMHDKSGGKEYLMSRQPGIGDLANAGVKIISDDGKSFVFNTPEAAALLDKYRDAYKAGYLPRTC